MHYSFIINELYNITENKKKLVFYDKSRFRNGIYSFYT